MTTENLKSDEQQESGASLVELSQRKTRLLFSNISPTLSEKELLAPGVHRLLIDELNRLQQQVDALTQVEAQYHQADNDRAVLQHRLSVSIAADVISGFCTSIGTALISIAPALWDKKGYGYALVGLGIVLLVGAVAAKF